MKFVRINTKVFRHPMHTKVTGSSYDIADAKVIFRVRSYLPVIHIYHIKLDVLRELTPPNS